MKNALQKMVNNVAKKCAKNVTKNVCEKKEEKVLKQSFGSLQNFHCVFHNIFLQGFRWWFWAPPGVVLELPEKKRKR